MDTQLESIQTLLRINRDALRALAKVAETTSADYVYIENAMNLLGEQFHILLQQKEELMANTEESQIITIQQSMAYEPYEPQIAAPINKRGRGAVKSFYLKEESLKPAFLAQLKRIFQAYYHAGKTFSLPDGTEAKAPDFLACLYDIGIKDGIASPEAPAYDMSCMIKEAACACENAQDFNTAYNTLQTAVRKWRRFTENEALFYGITIRFHKLKPQDVPLEHQADYNRWLNLYTLVEQIYSITKP